jgi:hypothetical protein
MNEEVILVEAILLSEMVTVSAPGESVITSGIGGGGGSISITDSPLVSNVISSGGAGGLCAIGGGGGCGCGGCCSLSRCRVILTLMLNVSIFYL